MVQSETQIENIPAQPVEEKSTGSLWMRVAALMIAVLVTGVILLLANRIQELQALGYLGAFLIMLVGNATVIFPVPGVIFVIAMGSTLNPWLVGLCAGPGAALGELTGYLAGYGGATPLEHTPLYKRFDRWMDRFGPLAIFVLAAIPNPFFDVAGLLAGASHMPWWQFLLAAGLGKTIQAILLAWAGALSLNWVAQFFT
jgi:membrane protein DedA with SNARE-associated domain